jgi:hypothetical protein
MTRKQKGRRTRRRALLQGVLWFWEFGPELSRVADIRSALLGRGAVAVI